jgi:hypothetical protein
MTSSVAVAREHRVTGCDDGGVTQVSVLPGRRAVMLLASREQALLPQMDQVYLLGLPETKESPTEYTVPEA